MEQLKSVTIETATKLDLPAIFALLDEHDLPRDGLSEHLSTTLVVRSGQTLVGAVALELYGPAALLRSVSVHPTVQGNGLGQLLVEAAVSLAKQRGVSRLYLLTEHAAGYFLRFGFQPISRNVVAPAVKRSVEFSGACPASAQVMVASLSAHSDTAFTGDV